LARQVRERERRRRHRRRLAPRLPLGEADALLGLVDGRVEDARGHRLLLVRLPQREPAEVGQ